MKNTFARMALLSSKINRQHIQFVLAIIALILLVLGVGAPLDGSGLTTH